jgi:hypothetical protein
MIQMDDYYYINVNNDITFFYKTEDSDSVTLWTWTHHLLLILLLLLPEAVMM